ncbi:MAG: HAMP domain-containing sensor histidine kinase [Myxococcota bacterium]|nr:HAMP domain-containing sensor histidine kinase [Myxococcota bacterium]
MESYAINHIVLGYLFAGTAHLAVMLWLLGHPARNVMKSTLCIWEAIGSIWHLGMGVSEIFLVNPEMKSFFGIPHVVWAKTTMTFSILTSMAVITFIYAILQRARDKIWLYWMVHLGVICVIILLGGNPWEEDGQEMIDLFGLIGPLFCYFFGLSLMIYTYFRNREHQLRMRIVCTTLGLGFAVVLFAVFGNILPQIYGWDSARLQSYILIFNGGWISSFVMIAAVRYGIVRMELDQIAEDIFTNMADPVILIDPSSRKKRINPAGSARFPSMFSHAPYPPIHEFIAAETMKQSPFETQTLVPREKSIFSCNLSTVQQGEEVLGQILVMRDITKEKEVDRMKTELTSTVSHELRTPLTSVLGFAKLIQKRFDKMVLPRFEPQNKKEARAIKQISQNLEVIVSEGTRLTNLINDVLDISKMEAGKLDWNIQSHEIDAVVQQALAASSGLFSRKPSVSLIEDHRSPMPTLMIDADRIIQVLLNLISNAVKFTAEGSVTVRSEIVDEHFQMSVVDQGVGIAEGNLSKVFEKYKQVGEQSEDMQKGTGLGLPISKEIIEYHNGKIWVESTLGEGSTFFFTLPINADRQTEE